MHFTSGADAKVAFEKYGFGPYRVRAGSRAVKRFKSKDLYYQSGAVSTASIGSLLAESQGDFRECFVWAFGLIWGDRSQEANPPEAWKIYAKWRQRHGETRTLYDAPCHVFVAGEVSDLARVIDLALRMGWDTLVAARPLATVIELSHDDRISVHARSRPTSLVTRLERLGVNGN